MSQTPPPGSYPSASGGQPDPSSQPSGSWGENQQSSGGAGADQHQGQQASWGEQPSSYGQQTWDQQPQGRPGAPAWGEQQNPATDRSGQGDQYGGQGQYGQSQQGQYGQQDQYPQSQPSAPAWGQQPSNDQPGQYGQQGQGQYPQSQPSAPAWGQQPSYGQPGQPGAYPQSQPSAPAWGQQAQQPQPTPAPEPPAGATGLGPNAGRRKLWIPISIAAGVLLVVGSILGVVTVANWSTPERTATQYVTAASEADCERLIELSSDEWDARLASCDEAEAQTAEIVAISETARQDDLAQVRAQLKLDGQPATVVFTLVKQGNDWKVQSVQTAR